MTIYNPEITYKVKNFLEKFGVLVGKNCVHLNDNQLDILEKIFGLNVSLYEFFDVDFVTIKKGDKFLIYYNKFKGPIYGERNGKYLTAAKCINALSLSKKVIEDFKKCQTQV